MNLKFIRGLFNGEEFSIDRKEHEYSIIPYSIYFSILVLSCLFVDCVRLAPSKIKPALDSACRNMRILSGLSQRDAADHSVISFIPALLLVCCPPDVSGPVSRIVVWESINTVPWAGPSTNKINERLKGVDPFVAHSNTPATIILEGGVIAVHAASFHFFPYFIFRRLGQPMCCRSDGLAFQFKATARSGFSTPQITYAHNNSFSAVALATPHGLSMLVV